MRASARKAAGVLAALGLACVLSLSACSLLVGSSDLIGTDAAAPEEDMAVAIDGGAADAATGGSLCGASSFVLCEDFEQPALGNDGWTREELQGALTRDTARAYRGSASAHVHVDGVDAGVTEAQLAYRNLVDPAAGGPTTMAARAFFFFPDSTSAVHVNGRLMIFQQTPAPYGGAVLASNNGVLYASNGFIDPEPDAGVTLRDLSKALPVNQWVCLELVVERSNPGTMKIYRDGQEITTLAITGNFAGPPPLLGFIVGAYRSQPVPLDYWVDEIAVDSVRIGCDR